MSILNKEHLGGQLSKYEWRELYDEYDRFSGDIVCLFACPIPHVYYFFNPPRRDPYNLGPAIVYVATWPFWIPTLIPGGIIGITIASGVKGVRYAIKSYARRRMFQLVDKAIMILYNGSKENFIGEEHKYCQCKEYTADETYKYVRSKLPTDDGLTEQQRTQLSNHIAIHIHATNMKYVW